MVTGSAGFALSAEPERGARGAELWEAELWEAELWGALTPAVLEQLEAALREAGGPPGRLLVRLERVTACGAEARARWVQLQRRRAAAGGRTAFLDPRPWGRGLALAVAHLAEDPRALAVAQLPRAHAWLEAGGERLADALALLGVRR